MGNGMDKIINGLYIGCLRDSKDLGQLSTNSITHILSIHENAKPIYKNIKYKCINLEDKPGQNIAKHFKKSVHFIHKARVKGENVLVHCIAGVSRSCTICAVYLMTIGKIQWDDAIRLIHSSRMVVNPNMGFKRQLYSYQTQNIITNREKLEKLHGQILQADVDAIHLILSTK